MISWWSRCCAARSMRSSATESSEKQIEIVRVPGRLRHSHRGAQIGAVAPLRGAHRARRRDPRPDAAFRLCRGRMRRRHRAHCAGNRRADRIRRADDRHGGAGRGSRRRQGRQQGRGCRAGRASKWPISCAAWIPKLAGQAFQGRSRARPASASRQAPRQACAAQRRRHRARSLARRLALQALYQMQLNPRPVADIAEAVRGRPGGGSRRSGLFSSTAQGDRAESRGVGFAPCAACARFRRPNSIRSSTPCCGWGCTNWNPARSCRTGWRWRRPCNWPSNSARRTGINSSMRSWIEPPGNCGRTSTAGPLSGAQ